jgi:hypothetical protein
MNKQVNALVGAMCLWMLPAAVLAEAGFPLPTPTYGWNMGNTLEPPCGEGCWGGPGSEALINAVADAGFNAVRIPCAWTSNSNSSGQINAAYMARVTQFVDWCLARNLHVIINSHWDGGWFDSCGFTSFDTNINSKLQSIWTQIATNFIDHDNERLLFSCTNEPDVNSQAKTDVLLQYYQTFINAVRATGGQNTSRWLVLSGPSTNIDYTDSFMNTLPNDPTPNRLMVEVHDYSPYQYTLMTEDAWWGNMYYFWGQGYHHPTWMERNPAWGEEDYIQSQHLKMKTKFVDQGIPVILGEFHATKRIGDRYPDLIGWDLDLHLASRTYYHKVMQDIANSNGLKPFYWDTPGGFFEWTTGSVRDQANITALTGGPALPPPSGGNAMGTVLYERWTGISDTSVSKLTSNANYPDNPSYTGQLTSLEGPANIADDYGSRIRGYLYPPTTGDYTFWIAGDDNCQLKISTDGSPAHASIIAYVNDWTEPRQWDKFTSQQSAAKSLVAGQKYYIEVLHKEGTGGDNIAVAWSGPGISRQVITGTYLSPWLTGLYGDFDGTGEVSINDLTEFAGVWLETDCMQTSRMDLDGDCVVDLYEFSQFAKNWMNDR